MCAEPPSIHFYISLLHTLQNNHRDLKRQILPCSCLKPLFCISSIFLFSTRFIKVKIISALFTIYLTAPNSDHKRKIMLNDYIDFFTASLFREFNILIYIGTVHRYFPN